MTDIGKPERATQNRVVKLFCDELGYRYLGDWADNSNIEEGLLTEYLTSTCYRTAQISTALYKLRTEANSHAIRLNTDLAKKPPECLEYIVVHELAQLLEPSHHARFVSVMNLFMPK